MGIRPLTGLAAVFQEINWKTMVRIVVGFYVSVSVLSREYYLVKQTDQSLLAPIILIRNSRLWQNELCSSGLQKNAR